MRQCVISLAVALAASVLAAFQAPIVANSSFEVNGGGKADGWRSNSDRIRVEAGAGVNGSGGVVWRSESPTRQCGISQRLKLEVGKAYRFDALMRCEGFTGMAQMCVEWSDCNGKWISGAYAGIRQRTTDWIRISGSTRDMPTNAASFTVMLYVPKGATGKVSFDNVNVSPLERDPVSYVVSSRYRDRIDNGPVTFHAALFPSDGATNLEATFSWSDADGKRRRQPANSLCTAVASLTLQADDLQLGKSQVSCELAAGKRTLGAASCEVERVANLPDLRVWIDRHKRCIVGGKPFFPVGMYSGKFDADKLAVYRKGPFNCVMPYSTVTIEEMDAAWSAGIMTFVNLKDCTLNSPWARRMKFTKQAEVDKWLKGKIQTYKNRPGLLGWYLNDESPLTEVPMRLHHYRLFREADAHHPVWIVIARAYDLREFSPTADVMGIDPYPVPERSMRYVTDFQRDAIDRIFDVHAFWNVPQCFNWGWHRSDLTKPGRFPSVAEMRSMCWQHIAGGANGLIGYVFGLGERFMEHWDDVCEVFSEVKRLSPILLSPEKCPSIRPSSESLAVRAWMKDGALYLLVCNVSETPLDAFVSIDGDEWRVVGMELGSPTTVSGGRSVGVSLPPLGVAVARLVRKACGKDLETAKWQAAIDAVAAGGGGTVTVPPGVHPVGQLDLKSNVRLHLARGAVLEGAAGMENYRIVTLPYSEGTWSAVVAGFGVTNVSITGEGEINGHGERFSMDFRDVPRGVCCEGLRPRGVVFADSADIRLEDFTLRDAGCWGIVFKRCDGILARRVKIDNHAHENNDGFDIEARNVLIEDCDVDGGDDGICVKSNDPHFCVTNVVVRRCTSRSHCNGFKLGTASHGTMRNIRFENCRADFPRRDFIDRAPGREGLPACRRKGFESYPNGVGISAICVECVDGGVVEDVAYDGIEIDGFMVPIFVRGGSRSGRTCGIPPSDKFVLRNITIRNVRGRAVSHIPSTISGVNVCRPQNVLLENVDIVCRGEGAGVSRPCSEPGLEFAGRYPEATMFKGIRLPAFGLYVDQEDCVTLRNVQFLLTQGDSDDRPPVYVSQRKTF